MRELEGVNDLFRSKYDANPHVREMIDKANKFSTRDLIDVMANRKNSRRNRRPNCMGRSRRSFNNSSASCITKLRNRSSRTNRRRGRKIRCMKYLQIYIYT